jgi:hypothetical protein
MKPSRCVEIVFPMRVKLRESGRRPLHPYQVGASGQEMSTLEVLGLARKQVRPGAGSHIWILTPKAAASAGVMPA